MGVAPVNVYTILQGGLSPADRVDKKDQDGTLADTFFEFDLIHADGYKITIRILHGCGDVGIFINPLEEIAAEEESVMIEVLGHH